MTHFIGMTHTEDHISVDLFTIFLEFPDRQSNLRGSLNNVQMLKILRLLRLGTIPMIGH